MTDWLVFFKQVDNVVWGAPLLILLVGTGIYLSFRLGLLQVFRLPQAFRLIFTEDQGEGDISSFGALATALAATVGTGNIVGVATAIQTGGPGALFWMWMAAFFGMATKYAEGLLAIRYRTKDDNGHISGGPMYYILHGMGEKWRPLAIFFALAGVLVALFGIGTMTQVNAITGALKTSFQLSPQVASLVIAGIVSAVIFGGIHWISKVSEKVVPFMAAAYIFATVYIIVLNMDQVPTVLSQVFQGAQSDSLLLLNASLSKMGINTEANNPKLLEQAGRIQHLEAQLQSYTQYETLSRNISGEIKSLWPNIQTISLSQAMEVPTDSVISPDTPTISAPTDGQKPHIVLAVVTHKGRFSEAERKRLQDWLKTRSKAEQLQLILRAQ